MIRECGAAARLGPCRHRVAQGQTRCYAHGGKWEPVPPLYRCSGTNNHGKPCHAKVPVEGGRCHFHPVEKQEAAQ